MMAASSSSRGIGDMNAWNSSTQNDMPKAISTRIRPCRVLKSASFCRTQIVGTTAGGMIRPDSMSTLTAMVHRLCVAGGRRRPWRQDHDDGRR